MLTRVNAWQTVTPLGDKLWNGFKNWMTILNSFILLTSCGEKLTHGDFRLALVKDLIQERRRVPQTTPRGRPTLSTDQTTRLKNWHNQHWPKEGKHVQCCVCSERNEEMQMRFKCEKCNVGLCIEPCLKLYHTKVHFWSLSTWKNQNT
jgi:hypothetical protein